MGAKVGGDELSGAFLFCFCLDVFVVFCLFCVFGGRRMRRSKVAKSRGQRGGVEEGRWRFSLFLGVRAEPVLQTLVRSSSHEGDQLLVLLERLEPGLVVNVGDVELL